MSEFKLISDYFPGGDQPQAIDKLAQGIVEGKKFQNLLGATATGKSVAWDEPVTVHLGADRYYRGPVGKLLDQAMGVEQADDSVEMAPPADWRIFAWDATTGRADWQPISALSRHASPEQMYRLQTACGREVVVTGDHSVWALRDGQLHLLPGDALRAGDALPVPLHIPEPAQPLHSLNLLDILRHTGSKAAVDVGKAFRCDTEAKRAMKPFYAQPGSKMWRMRNSDERVNVGVACALLERDMMPLDSVRLHGKFYSQPAKMPLTPEFAIVLGQYLAEGHAAERFALFSTREAEVQDELARCLQACGIASFRRGDGDFVVATKVWRDVFHALMGGLAGAKRLPAFWPALSNSVLAALLSGYFEGDGGLDGGAITAVTLSRQLAADVVEALLRFGIWAGMRPVSKRKPNGEYGSYYKITVSGAENLQRFAAQIGFISRRKTQSLADNLRDEHTNVDLVFGVGPRLLLERQSANILQRDVAERAGCTRTMISAIECGIRHPSRKLFERICAAINIQDSSFTGLAQVHWSPLEVIEQTPAKGKYVYDFSVAGYETFLTGRGGVFVHNTYTMANVIQKVQRPTLVMAHNKTLAAQLCSEFREFFPENAVEFFVSYYDYYQPEAYIPSTDTYIEKDSQVNDEINRLRHSSTQSLLERRDVIVVSSVSCIYGLGSPDEYKEIILTFKRGQPYDREDALRRLIDMQFTRNNMELTRGTFRVRGDTLEIQPADEEIVIRVEFFGDDVEKITLADPLTGEIVGNRDTITVFSASHFVTSKARLERAIIDIEAEMIDQVAYFRRNNQLLEAQRIEQRTRFDIEMMKELGYCSGIENYSRYMDGRAPGTAPYTLLDYFPKDYLLIIDESHQTLPQVRGMYNGDKARKETLINYGFRLPSASDNRPLKFNEYEERINQVVFVTATPGPYEKEHSEQVVEQIIRPTGLVDPEIVVRPTKGQIDDLIEEIRKRVEKQERVLVTTLTKKMAEDLTEYLEDLKMKVNYLHSDIKTMERSEILRNLRLGVHDVLVGINLLREGLDLPEVTLVAILDADKEGFLRSETSLIQTIGRAARNVGGQVIMYADNLTGSMSRAIEETNRRREKQVAYNLEHGITPQTVRKAVRDLIMSERVAEEANTYSTGNATARLKADPAAMSLSQVEEVIGQLEKEMKDAARALNFEYAAELRDEVNELRKLVPASKVGQDTGTSGLGKDKALYGAGKAIKAAKTKK